MQFIECNLCENFQLAIFCCSTSLCLSSSIRTIAGRSLSHNDNIIDIRWLFLRYPSNISFCDCNSKNKNKAIDCIFAFLICNFVANATVSKRTLLKNELLSPNLTMLVCENDRNKVYKTVLIDTHWQQAGRLKCHLQISATQQRTDNKYLRWNQSVHINHSNPTLVHLNQHWSHSFFRSKNCALMKNFNRFIPGLSKYD